MRNLKFDVDQKSGKLTVTVNLKEATAPSKTGKTEVVAGTEGSAKVEGTDWIANITIYKKKS